MTEWIGHLLMTIPQWLFIPALIVVIILAIIGWWIWAVMDAASYGINGWPFKSRRVYLGEKKNAKK
jgi:hypothetical protein